MAVTSQPSITHPDISIEPMKGSFGLDVQVTPAPTRTVQQRIERQLFDIAGVSGVVADAMGGFYVSVANEFFDLGELAAEILEMVRVTATGALPLTVRVIAKPDDQEGWWVIETDRRHGSRKLLHSVAYALHAPPFTGGNYYGGGYNMRVMAVGPWRQSEVEACVREVINRFYAKL